MTQQSERRFSLKIDVNKLTKWQWGGLMLIACILSAGLAVGSNTFFITVTLEQRLQALEDQVNIPVNSTISAMMKEASYIISKHGEYTCLINGTDDRAGRLEYFSTEARSVLNNAYGNCSAGQSIFLREGRFVSHGEVTLKSNVSLRGSGYGTILDFSNSTDQYALNGANVENIEISNLRIVGANNVTKWPNTAIVWNGVDATRYGNLLVSNVWFEDFLNESAACIYVMKTNGTIRVEKCNFKSIFRALVVIEYTRNVWFTDNFVNGYKVQGVDLEPGEDAPIENLYFERNTLISDASSVDHVAFNLQLSHSGLQKNIYVAQNIINCNGVGSGIRITRGRNVQCTGNIITNATQTNAFGITLRGSNNTLVQGNTAEFCYYGIKEENYDAYLAGYNDITHNILKSNTFPLVYVAFTDTIEDNVGFVSPSDQIGAASVIISTDGATVTAVNCTSGAVMAQSTNESSVWNTAISDCINGGKIFFTGYHEFTNDLVIPAITEDLVIEGMGYSPLHTLYATVSTLGFDGCAITNSLSSNAFGRLVLKDMSISFWGLINRSCINLNYITPYFENVKISSANTWPEVTNYINMAVIFANISGPPGVHNVFRDVRLRLTDNYALGFAVHKENVVWDNIYLDFTNCDHARGILLTPVQTDTIENLYVWLNSAADDNRIIQLYSLGAQADVNVIQVSTQAGCGTTTPNILFDRLAGTIYTTPCLFVGTVVGSVTAGTTPTAPVYAFVDAQTQAIVSVTHSFCDVAIKNSGSTASCMNGTWIATGLAGAPTTARFQINGTLLINATCYVITPTIISQNSTHVQIEFLYNNAGTIAPVSATESKTILWYFEYKP